MTRAKDISKILTDADFSGTLDVTGVSTLNSKVGILGTNDLGLGLHIKEGDSGVTSVSTDADQLVIENNAESGISILAPTNSASRIAFGDSDNNKIGMIYYNHSSNFMKFDVNNAERMRINNDGNVLIGRTSELFDFGDGRTSLVLQGSGAEDYATIQIGNNGTGSNNQILGHVGFYDGTNENTRVQGQRGDGTDVGDLLFFTRSSGGSLTEAMRVYRNGNVGIGTTEPNRKLQVISDATSTDVIDCRSSSSSYTGNAILVGSNTNTTNSTYNHIRADIHGVAQKFAVRDSGNVVNANNSYGSLSDERIKSDITDASSQWNDIKSLRVRKFKKYDTGDEINIGLIAQEVETAGMNGLVEENNPDKYHIAHNSVFGILNSDGEIEEIREKVKSVKYSVLYMKAVKALQEAMTRIETLETAKTDLEARITALETA